LRSLTDVSEAAPDWYEERKTALSGEGYPRLSDVPRLRDYPATDRTVDSSMMNDAQLLAAFEASPRSEPTYLTPAEIKAWGDQLRASVAERPVPTGFLTDADIQQLKARFDRPRARR
jgi:hypothetical protein